MLLVFKENIGPLIGTSAMLLSTVVVVSLLNYKFLLIPAVISLETGITPHPWHQLSTDDSIFVFIAIWTLGPVRDICRNNLNAVNVTIKIVVMK